MLTPRNGLPLPQAGHSLGRPCCLPAESWVSSRRSHGEVRESRGQGRSDRGC